MKRLRTLVLMSLFLVAALLGPSQLRAKEVCIPINAKADGVFTAPLVTAGQITGGGVLHGTTTAEWTLTGPIGPSTSFEGTLEITTVDGTLTLFITNGIWNVLSGEFSYDSVVTAGTGRFDGATGGLFFHGFTFGVRIGDATFVDDEISGEICLEVP